MHLLFQQKRKLGDVAIEPQSPCREAVDGWINKTLVEDTEGHRFFPVSNNMFFLKHDRDHSTNLSEVVI